MIIKKIFERVSDEEVHSDLLKFGRGEFKDKYLIEAKKQADKWSIKTGPEYANFLVKRGLEKISDKVFISGAIISTFDIRAGMGGSVFSSEEEVRQFMGIKQLKVNLEVNSSRVLEVMARYHRAFFALSFSLPGYELKIKSKAPKSVKPSSGGEKKAGADFCSLKTTDVNFIKELFFDFPNFKEISVKHTIKIDEMIYPKDFVKIKPEEVREKSKRKGVLIREVVIDGKSEKREAYFEA